MHVNCGRWNNIPEEVTCKGEAEKRVGPSYYVHRRIIFTRFSFSHFILLGINTAIIHKRATKYFPYSIIIHDSKETQVRRRPHLLRAVNAKSRNMWYLHKNKWSTRIIRPYVKSLLNSMKFSQQPLHNILSSYLLHI